MKIYTAIIEERSENLATITAENSDDAKAKALEGDYESIRTRTLPPRIKSIRFRETVNQNKPTKSPKP